MHFGQDLRIKLQERRNRLYKATHHVYSAELKYLMDALSKSSYALGLIEELKAQTTGISLEKWKENDFGRQKLILPDQEIEKARICFEIIHDCLSQTDPVAQAELGYIRNVSTETNFTAMLREFTEVFVDPFLNYLHDQIDVGGSILYLLGKYKNKVEWFTKKALFYRYCKEPSKGEAYLDAHMREFLTDQGVDYPFSSPASPSGRADIVANLQTPEPLVLEVKIFDLDKGYDKTYIKKGFTQVYAYAEDYSKSVGYLVIFNMCDCDLIIETIDDIWPTRITINNKTFFIITVNLSSQEKPASKRGKLKRYEIHETYLTSK